MSTESTTTPQTGVRASFGALVDMVAACRPVMTETAPASVTLTARSDEFDAEAAASMRMVAVLFAGGYQVGMYKGIFAHLDHMVADGMESAAIVRELIDTYGSLPHTKL